MTSRLGNRPHVHGSLGHVIWDWNGTLIDDFEARLCALNYALSQGDDGGLVTAERYRTHFTRPIRLFYERLRGAPMSNEELSHIGQRYATAFRRAVGDASLARHAADALERVSTVATQSLLSMAFHDELLVDVERLGVVRWFIAVEGGTDDDGASKTEALRDHVAALGLEEARTILVGDAIDDAVAARAAGIRAVLVDGTHVAADLARTGCPVAGDLLEAAELTIDLLHGAGERGHAARTPADMA